MIQYNKYNGIFTEIVAIFCVLKECNRMKDEYQSPFMEGDDLSSSSFSSEELFSNSENQLDFNSFADKNRNRSTEAGKTGRKKYGKQPKEKKTKSRFLKALLSVFLVCTITFCLVIGTFMIYVFGFVDDDIQENLNNLKLNSTTVIYVKNAKTGKYQEYQRLHGSENRIWVSYDEERAMADDPEYKGIPRQLCEAFIAIEDKRFESHDGVDWKRTFAAFVNMFVDLYSSNQGGSTITQQLVKNLTQDNRQSPMRKIREIMRARKIESTYGKDTILECYLNTVSFANGIGGVEVAANYYFKKNVHELTLAECASLAAIVKEPERYRPDKNPMNNAERRRTVLYEMKEQGYITQEEYEKAAAQEVKIVADKSNIKEVEVNSYFVDALIDNVVDALVEKYNFDKSYAEQNFYNGGYKIYATLDTEIQKIIDDVYTKPSNFVKRNGVTAQSSFTIMDYAGHVVGISGGVGEKKTNRGLNRATDSPRSPGSSIKPIATYSLALDNNMISYSSIFKDRPITLSNGKKWPPNANGSYGGSVTAAKALEVSKNTVPAQLVEKLGMENVYNHLVKDMGITTLTKNANADLTYSALALGSCYKGITSLESCAAFATFGNKGKYYKPSFFTKVTDQQGNLVLDGNPAPKIAMAEDTAVIMNHMLRNVIDGSSGTGRSVRSYVRSMPLFGKTGTTNDSHNLWFAGGSPYYAASCWYGYDTPASVYPNNSARKIWGTIMGKVHKNLEKKEFAESSYVTCRRYCLSSGMVATERCSSTAIGWFKTSQLIPCSTHGGTVRDEVNTSSKATATSSKATSASGSSSKKTTATSSQKPTSDAASSSKPVETSSDSTTTVPPVTSKPESSITNE